MSLSPGARLGPYEVLSLLGTGGMGEVYRARDARLGREVALKVLPEEFASDPERLRRFEQEARAAGALNHPHVVAVFDVGRDGGAPYVVSELLEGETLRERMPRGMSVKKALEMGLQIAHGLAAAHDKGIVHRDLKPENVFVTRDGRVKILDFGLAKLRRSPAEEKAESQASTRTHATDAGMVMGTVGYMSPEQVRGVPADHRSDIFSLGAVLYEMLSGQRAFQRETAPETMTAILREEVPPASAANAAVPPALDRIVARCLDKQPEERFQSARDVAFALEALSGGSATTAIGARARTGRWARLGGGALSLALAALLAGWLGRQSPGLPRYQPLTFEQGSVWSARFAPDGDTIVYSAAWAGQPIEVFSTRRDSHESRALGLSDARLLAVSSKGEMALLLQPQMTAWEIHQGTLARAPLAGGAPRELAEDVQDADWSPDGEKLEVTRWVNGHCRLEYPMGTVLYAPPVPIWISSARMSPDGRRIAFFEHPVAGDNRGSLSIVEVGGLRHTLAEGFSTMTGLAWSPDGNEVWISAHRVTGGVPQDVYGIGLSGRERRVNTVPGGSSLFDVSTAGRALISRGTASTDMWFGGAGQTRERGLATRGMTWVEDLSADGRTLVGTHAGQLGGPNSTIFVRKTAGGLPVLLGEGDAQALSPDGKWVLTRLLHTRPEGLALLPTGAGEVRMLANGGVERYLRANWLPDGRRVVFTAVTAGREPRLYVQDLDAPQPRAVCPEGLNLPPMGSAAAPDGRRVAALDADQSAVVCRLDGGEPEPVPGLEPGDLPIRWTSDGEGLFYVKYADDYASIHRVDLATGRTKLHKQLAESTPTGMVGRYRVVITPDGASYAYNYGRYVSDLYLVEGLR